LRSITTKNTLPSSPTVMVPKSVSGTFTCVVDAGVSTGSGSGARAVAVNIKNVSNKKDTSHMAVMSIVVLALFTFTFGMLVILVYYYIDTMQLQRIFHKSRKKFHHFLFVTCRICLYDREASLVNRIGEGINFRSK